MSLELEELNDFSSALLEPFYRLRANAPDGLNDDILNQALAELDIILEQARQNFLAIENYVNSTLLGFSEDKALLYYDAATNSYKAAKLFQTSSDKITAKVSEYILQAADNQPALLLEPSQSRIRAYDVNGLRPVNIPLLTIAESVSLLSDSKTEPNRLIKAKEVYTEHNLLPVRLVANSTNDGLVNAETLANFTGLEYGYHYSLDLSGLTAYLQPYLTLELPQPQANKKLAISAVKMNHSLGLREVRITTPAAIGSAPRPALLLNTLFTNTNIYQWSLVTAGNSLVVAGSVTPTSSDYIVLNLT